MFLSEQQLAKDEKISSQDTQADVTGISDLAMITAPGQPVAGLQRANCRFNASVLLSCLSKLNGRLDLLFGCLFHSELR